MATTVILAFDKFLSDTINLDTEQTKKARGSREWLVGQIESFPDKDNKFPAIYSEKNIFYGLFSRNTKKRPLDDIDLMICLSADGCTGHRCAPFLKNEKCRHKNAIVKNGTINKKIKRSADVGLPVPATSTSVWRPDSYREFPSNMLN